MVFASREQLLATVKNLLDSGTFSDLTVTCGTDSYKVHKNIVCSRADSFARAVRFPGTEGESSEIDLPEDETAVVKSLMQYLYEGDYGLSVADGEHVTERSEQSFKECTSVGKREKIIKTPVTSTLKTFPHHYHEDYDDLDYTDDCHFSCQHHTCGSDCDFDCLNFVRKECTNCFSGSDGRLLMHAKMYEIADKYDVTGLKGLVIDKIQQGLSVLLE